MGYGFIGSYLAYGFELPELYTEGLDYEGFAKVKVNLKHLPERFNPIGLDSNMMIKRSSFTGG